MNMAFATCVQLGLSCIEEIYRIGGELTLLITLKDDQARDKSGRVYLDSFADQHNLPLLKINSINDHSVIQAIDDQDIDWLFIIGWSQIVGPELLKVPKRGCIGMHPTLLPAGRGRASIPWAILKGLEKTGVTMFKLDEGIDTGDIIGQAIIELKEHITATELYQKANDMHVVLISKYWTDIVNDRIILTKQKENEATVWPGRKPEDGEIFSSMSMEEADIMVRAVTHPYPGAFFRDKDKIIRIWSAKIDAGAGMVKLADGFITPLEYEIQ